MSDPYRWIGSKDIVQLQSRWTQDAESITLVVPFTGPYATLITSGPKPGQTIPGYESYGLKINKIDIQEEDGGSGRLTATMDVQTPPASDTGTAPLGEPIYEIEWGQLTKSIETHVDCGVLKADRPRYDDKGVATGDSSGKRRTWDDWADLTDDDYSSTGDQWTLDVYQGKRRKGIESYNRRSPVIRRTLYYHRQPPGVGDAVDKIQSPPAAANPPAKYQFLCTDDECVKEGRKRTRRTVWTGSKDIDLDLYKDAV